MEFRGDQCPARLPGLSHTMNGRRGTPCVECGVPLTEVPPGTVPPTATQAEVRLDGWPRIDVSSRLRALGLAGTYASVTGPTAMEQTEPATYHETDGTIVEPRMITGDGPVGRPWAKGRGEFTWRDMKRTVNTVEYRQYLAEHGGGEEE